MKVPASVDDYIAQCDDSVRSRLEQIRNIIRKTAPELIETIKYSMPAYALHGNVVYFAAGKNHIGLYPAPRTNSELLGEMKPYLSGKASLRFPLADALPQALIRKVVRELVAANKKKKPKANPVKKRASSSAKSSVPKRKQP